VFNRIESTAKKLDILLNKKIEFKSFIPQKLKFYFSPHILYSWEYILFIVTNLLILFDLFVYIAIPLMYVVYYLYFPKEGCPDDGCYNGIGVFSFITAFLISIFIKYISLPIALLIIYKFTKNQSIKSFIDNIKFKDIGIILLIALILDICILYIKQFLINYFKIFYDMKTDIWYGGLFGSYLFLTVLWFINKVRIKYFRREVVKSPETF